MDNFMIIIRDIFKMKQKVQDNFVWLLSIDLKILPHVRQLLYAYDQSSRIQYDGFIQTVLYI